MMALITSSTACPGPSILTDSTSSFMSFVSAFATATPTPVAGRAAAQVSDYIGKHSIIEFHGGGLKGRHVLSPPRRGNVDLPLDYEFRRTDYMMQLEVRLARTLPTTAVCMFVRTYAAQTIKSVYLMWGTTGNSIWRERGWKIFQNVQKYSTVPGGGMATIEDVRNTKFEMPR